jgi:hypothetical protein
MSASVVLVTATADTVEIVAGAEATVEVVIEAF